MEPLTNLVGAVLVVMAAETTPIYETNQVGITCEQAGCTNWTECDVQIEVEPAYRDPECPAMWIADNQQMYHVQNCKCRAATYRNEKRRLCPLWHFTNEVVHVATVERITVGAHRPRITLSKSDDPWEPFAYEGRPARPLFDILRQIVTTNAQHGMTFYREGTWIERNTGQ